MLPPSACNLARSLIFPLREDPYDNRDSLEFRFRARRFEKVRALIEDILAEKGSARILDLGGTETYWRIGQEFLNEHRSRLQITLLNPQPQFISDKLLFVASQESATNPGLLDVQRFDLVHANSVIEHVGDWPEFEIFARNVRRLAPRYFVQTPNYWFPYEPHYRFPGFQYLPSTLRAKLLMHFELGFFSQIESFDEALDVVHHHRLLSTREMATLFPDGIIHRERWMGFDKSIMAIRS